MIGKQFGRQDQVSDDLLKSIEVPLRPEVDVKNVPIKIVSVSEYQRHHLSVETRRKLEVAPDLMNKKESE